MLQIKEWSASQIVLKWTSYLTSSPHVLRTYWRLLRLDEACGVCVVSNVEILCFAIENSTPGGSSLTIEHCLV